MERIKIKGYITYPCCPKEKNLVYEGAHGKNSCRCGRCGKFLLFDYDKMEANIISAVKGATYH